MIYKDIRMIFGLSKRFRRKLFESKKFIQIFAYFSRALKGSCIRMVCTETSGQTFYICFVLKILLAKIFTEDSSTRTVTSFSIVDSIIDLTESSAMTHQSPNGESVHFFIDEGSSEIRASNKEINK